MGPVQRLHQCGDRSAIESRFNQVGMSHMALFEGT